MNLLVSRWGKTALAVCLFTVASPAAILGTYSDRTTWQAAVNGSPTDTPFTNSSTFNMASTGITESSGASFVGYYNESSSGFFSYRQNDAGYGGELNLGSFGFFFIGGGSTTSNYNAGISMNPGAGITAVGFDFGSFADDGASARINSNSTTQYLIRVFEGGNPFVEYTVNGANRPGLSFFGVATSGNISNVQLLTRQIGPNSSYTTYGIVDNFSFGTTSLTAGGGGGEGGGGGGGEVPEPSTYALAGLGLVTMIYFRRRS